MVPSLVQLCIQRIVANDTLYLESCDAKPSLTIIEMIENGRILSGKWSVTRLLHENPEFEFHLISKSDKEFSTLSPVFQVTKVIEFVKGNGKIKGIFGEVNLTSGNTKRLISLYYEIPNHESAIPVGNAPKIAEIEYPNKNRRTVKVTLCNLSEIDQKVETSCNQETYHKVRNFLIYYVNQLAIDNPKTETINFYSVLKMEHRINKARSASDKTHAAVSLFGTSIGPEYYWD